MRAMESQGSIALPTAKPRAAEAAVPTTSLPPLDATVYPRLPWTAAVKAIPERLPPAQGLQARRMVLLTHRAPALDASMFHPAGLAAPVMVAAVRAGPVSAAWAVSV